MNTTAFQNWVVTRVTVKLSKDLNAKVSIRHVEFGLFNKMLLEGTLVQDKKNDTLLYAETAKVNITDWFFLRDNVTLKYISLSDAVINLNRKDSTWNYQFLSDYFSSPAKKSDTAKNVLKLDLKTVELNRVIIRKKDEWAGQNAVISVNKLNFTTDVFDTKNKIIKINDISLDQPLYAEHNYIGGRPKSLLPAGRTLLKNGLQWNEDDWQISVKNIQIKDGGLQIENDNGETPVTGLFDGSHIIASAVNGNLKDVRLSRDTITARIHIAAKDRSGFEIKKLSAAYTFTPAKMEFKDLDLITNRSHVKNYYVMRYTDFNKDFAEFSQAVSLEADFSGSLVSSEDIAFFAPGVRSWQRDFLLDGNVRGNIAGFSGDNITIRSGNSFLNGDIAIRGLSVSDKPFFSLRSNDLRTNYADLASLVPSLKNVSSPNLRALGNLHFTGSFTGFISDFVTYGTISSDLGTVITDIHMRLTGSVPDYSGKIATTNFNLGRFTGDSHLGNISFNGNISGKGFTAKNVDVTLDGNVRQFGFNDYTYQNITTKGNFRNNVFNGTVSIDDPNIKITALNGKIDLSGAQPQFNFDADVTKLNLKNIQLTNDDFSLTGKFNLHFSGNNIDNFLGSAKIYNAGLLDNGQKLSFDSLLVSSYITGGEKYLSVQSNELDANVAGNFKILELPDAFQLLLNRYYPSYIKKPAKIIHDQDFTFDIKTKVINDYIGLLSKKIGGFNNTDVSGYLNLSANTLDIKADVPVFNYGNINFTNVNFTGAGTFDTLKLNGKIGDVVINDSLHLPDTRILLSANNDISDINVTTSASKTLNAANLSLRLQALPNGFKLNFNPSSFVINDKKWILERGGELVLDNKLLTASEVKFVQNNQQVIISTAPSAVGSNNDVLVDIKKIDIGDIAPFFIRSPRFEGSMTGHLKINDPFGNMTLGFVTQTDAFRFEGDSIGILKTSGSYNAATGDVVANASSNNSEYNFIADINFKLKDSTNNQLNGSLNLDRSNIHFLQKYLNSVFTGLEGNATGQLNITGRGKDPKVTGSVALNDASLIVNYTRCKYFFNNNSILTFNKDEIDFGTLRIRDTLHNTATVTGKLYHTFFDNFYFSELHFKTDRKNGLPGKFLLINTTAKDNKEFYGHVIGDADMRLDGPISNLKMNISGQPTDSSHIYLPTGDVAETGKINYIEFLQFGREMRSDQQVKEEANIKVNMEITATPFAQIDVILDETTGDIIKAQGSGKLNIDVGSREPLSIRGRYDVEEGQYTFNFQTFLKTPFTLQSGFIEWQGDPYLANLNIDAVYRARQVDLSSIPTSLGATKDKNDVDVLFKLRGTLKNPSTDFEFQFPFGNPLKSDPIANQYLKTKYQADKNQMNKQVTSLLLFNSFVPEQQSLLSTNNTGNFVFKSVGQVLSSTLSSSLNNWLQKLLKTDQVNLYTNINTPDFNFEKGGTQRQIQTLGNFGFKTAFLNNRLLINFGGNVDYRLVAASSNSSTNFLFTPDVSFEYLITPGGGLRVVGFNRSDADLGDIAGVTRRNRTGILLSYRKDFNSFYELFGIAK